ncbi:MAG: cell shape determination protein CcmA [Bacteroidetes bacterium RIFCSPLOWO2_02_FULL_36_8]|nr:MAG: cell shape determination protein CcmA [Bacteroidetes bacterium RIFCSPLOWO2_02_FULL_36_8]OFY69205.1 MAG: cell shape determination protein CcmA [Bacteroidetes bacterium RIFCSPLOWO2_12_FULL_37_12]
MFGNSKNPNELAEMAKSNNIIGKGTLIDGNIESFASIRVDGKIIGDIRTKAKAVLGDSSVLQGNLVAQNAEVAGELKGKLEISELLILKSTANIHGEIHTNKLVVEAGATFNGTCNMGAVVKEIKIGNHKADERETEERQVKHVY